MNECIDLSMIDGLKEDYTKSYFEHVQFINRSLKW